MDKIQAAAAEMGVIIQSTRVTQPPVLYPGFNFYVEAFWRLHTCRPQGFNEVAWIPWTATEKYAERYELTHVSFYRFIHMIECMDDAYRKYVQSKTPEKTDGSDNDGTVEQKANEARR